MQSQSAEQEFNKREEGEATVVSEDTLGGHPWRTLSLELNAEGVDYFQPRVVSTLGRQAERK
jgi:hypothetical protein